VFIIVFSKREEKSKQLLKDQDEQLRKRLHEVTLLRGIQDKIGYSLNMEYVIETLTTRIRDLFPYSTISSIILKDRTITLKHYLEEHVSTRFLESVKDHMIKALAILSDIPLPNHINEIKFGLTIDENNAAMVESFFHIPFTIGGTILGILSISSDKKGIYDEENITIVYQLTNQAFKALSHLQRVINTEEVKLLTMINGLADGIFTVNIHYDLVLINNTAKELLNLSMENPTIFDVLSALSKNGDFGQKIKEAIIDNKPKEEKEMTLGNKIVQVIITPVVTKTLEGLEEVVGASIVLHDITLEKSVTRMKEDFTASIVHELRSPLTAIKASAQLMKEEKEKLDKAQEEKLIDIIHKQSERMLSDINSLLDAAKLDSGHFTISQKPTDINSIILDSVGLFHAEAKNKYIILNVDIEKNLPMVFIDPDRIAQVINNLISNSMKFTPGGGTITIHAHMYTNDHLSKNATNPRIIVAISILVWEFQKNNNHLYSLNSSKPTIAAQYMFLAQDLVFILLRAL
jgi:signal transduction histidine kinase